MMITIYKAISAISVAVAVFTPIFLLVKYLGWQLGHSGLLDWLIIWGSALAFLAVPTLRELKFRVMIFLIPLNAFLLFFLALELMIWVFGEAL